MSQDIKYMQLRMDDMLVQADMMAKQIEIMKRIYELQSRMTDITHDTIEKTKEMAEVIYDLRGHVSDFEDFSGRCATTSIGKSIAMTSRYAGH